MSTPARPPLRLSLRTPVLAPLLVACALGAGSCTKAGPALAVGLMTDLVKVDDPLAKVQVVAKRDGRVVADRTLVLGAAAGQFALPYAFLVELDDAEGATVRVDVTGTLASGRTLVRAANLKALGGAPRFFRMALAASCLDASCGETETCIEGRCEPLDFDAARLPNFIEGEESVLQCSTSVAAKRTDTAVVMGTRAPGACSGTDVCLEGTCYRLAKSCTNTTRDGWETDVDCGWGCALCSDGDDCTDGRDCESRVCGKAGTCQRPTCADRIKNNDESDVDCGGAACARCLGGAACLANGDCRSGVCTQGRCAGPTCADGAFNGNETDLDCGGPDCAPCPVDKACAKNTDCASAACDTNKCVALFAESKTKVSRITTGKSPHGILATDFDGDNLVDLAFTNSAGQSVGVAISMGDGTFWSPTTYPLALDPNTKTSSPWALRAADIDGDGWPDMLVATNDGLSVHVLRGNRFGFQIGPPLWMGGPVRDCAIADLNGDGILDLVAPNYYGVAQRLWSVFNGGWTGAFGLGSDLEIDYDTTSIDLGDVNEDMHLDVVVASEKPSTISVLLGDGKGQYTPKLKGMVSTLKIDKAGFSPRHARLADLNGDKHLDLVVADASSNEVCVLLGQGTGVFNDPQHYPLPGTASQVEVADVNGDGRPDLVVANNGLSVLLGRKDGSWADPVTYSATYKVNNLAIADFDRDGRPDLAVTGAGTDQIIVLLNQSH